MERRRVLIFANGSMNGWPGDLVVSPGQDLIICADGGLAQALRWNLTPQMVIGDLDSADPDELNRLAARGVEIVRHPAEKDETDLELALEAALRYGPGEIIVLGGFGRRLDMTLANVFLLASARFFPDRTGERRPVLSLMDEHCRVFFLRGPARCSLEGRTGGIVSLLPLGGPARGVTLEGLEYPLEEADLELGSTRGVSNVVREAPGWVTLRKGGLLAAVSHGE